MIINVQLEVSEENAMKILGVYAQETGSTLYPVPDGHTVAFNVDQMLDKAKNELEDREALEALAKGIEYVTILRSLL